MTGDAPSTGYAPSPRPTYGRATAIPYATVTRHLWASEIVIGYVRRCTGIR